MAILQRKVSAQRCTITRVFYTILLITPWPFFLYLCMYTYQLETRLCFHMLGSLELFGTVSEIFGLSPDMIRFSSKNPGTCRIKISHPWLKKRLAGICLFCV